MALNKAIAANEKVAFYGEDVLERATKCLHNAGFTPLNIKKIILEYPEILRINPEQIEKRLEMWHICQFSKTQFFDLFVQCPELIEFDNEEMLSKRYAQLRSIVATPKNIWRLLMSSPNVLVDDMRSIQKKVDYVVENMEADVTDLVKSGTLGQPMDKIKTRHTLLVRLGLFKKRNPRASELNPNKNPRLFRIMDVGDEEFATRTCGISIKELEAFTELYEREMEEMAEEEIDWEEDSDLESDYDSESDEDDFDPREKEDYYDGRNRRRYKKKHE